MTDAGVPDAWVKIPTEEEVRPTFQSSPYFFGFVPAMGRLIVAHDTIGPYFGALFSEIMFAPGTLSRTEREMIAAVTAAAQDCHY